MDAIPLPPRPDLGHYKKLAKELLAASQDEDALRGWAARWLDSLARLGVSVRPPGWPDGFGRDASSLTARVRKAPPSSLSDAQRIVAQMHGFSGWSAFSTHVRRLGPSTTISARFEAAVDAIVAGDLQTLERNLLADLSIVRARSSRQHQSTLLHYVAANGVEDFRQRTPANIVEIAKRLLEAGAEVDAVNHDYGPGTTLGLVATSTQPRQAGVQIALMELLVAAGAAIDGVPGGWQPLSAALANGCPEAAAWLAARGARMTFTSAAAFGRMDLLEEAFRAAEAPAADQITEAFRLACNHGRTAAIAFLLDRGAGLAPPDGRQTGLHLAADGGHLEAVHALLARGAPLEVKNQFGGTVLDQALWSSVHGDRGVDYLPVVEALIAAGAKVDPAWSTGIERIDAVLKAATSAGTEG